MVEGSRWIYKVSCFAHNVQGLWPMQFIAAKGKEAPRHFQHIKFVNYPNPLATDGDTCTDDWNLEGRRIVINLPRDSQIDQVEDEDRLYQIYIIGRKTGRYWWNSQHSKTTPFVLACIKVAQPRGRGRLSRNVPLGLTKEFGLSVTAK